MKVKLKKQKNEFKPIKMEIVFECQEEINDLYNRINLSAAVVERETGEQYLHSRDYSSWVIYEQLKNLI